MNNLRVKKMFSNLTLIQKLSKLLPPPDKEKNDWASDDDYVQVNVELTKGEIKKIMQLIVQDSTSEQTFIDILDEKNKM